MKKTEESRPLYTTAIVFCHLFPIHMTPEEFENEGLIPKMVQIGPLKDPVTWYRIGQVRVPLF